MLKRIWETHERLCMERKNRTHKQLLMDRHFHRVAKSLFF